MLAGLLHDAHLAVRRTGNLPLTRGLKADMRDLTKDHRWLSLNTATVRRQGDLIAIIEACARHGIGAISPWRDQVAQVGLERAAKAVRDARLALSGYCRGGMFTGDRARRLEIRDDNRRAVDEAKALGASTVILVAGGLPQFSRPGSAASKHLSDAHAVAEEGIAELYEYAAAADVPLAIEPLHPMYAADRACINTLAHALDICDRLDPEREGGLGVAVDVYHVWWDPTVMAQLKRASGRLLAFHVCDWLVPTNDMLNDRGMMGDGVIDIKRLRAAVEAAGYAGHIEVEIFSQRWWSVPMDDVLTTAIARLKSAV